MADSSQFWHWKSCVLGHPAVWANQEDWTPEVHACRMDRLLSCALWKLALTQATMLEGNGREGDRQSLGRGCA